MRFNFIQRQSLKTRLTLFTLAIFLIGIWLLAFYTTRLLHEDTQRLLGEQQFSTVSLVAEQVNEDLEDRVRVLKKVADEIKPAMLDDVPTLQALLNQRTFFQSMFNAGVIVVRADGTAIAELPLSAARIGVNYSEVDSIHAALTEGKSSIGKPVIGKTLGQRWSLLAQSELRHVRGARHIEDQWQFTRRRVSQSGRGRPAMNWNLLANLALDLYRSAWW